MLSSDRHMPTQNNKVRLKNKAVFGVEASQCVVFVTGAGLTRTHEEGKSLHYRRRNTVKG